MAKMKQEKLDIAVLFSGEVEEETKKEKKLLVPAIAEMKQGKRMGKELSRVKCIHTLQNKYPRLRFGMKNNFQFLYPYHPVQKKS